MGLFGLLLGRPKVIVHVIDSDHPDGRFMIQQRVAPHVFERFASGGELFASTTFLKPAALRRFPGFVAGGEVYTYMDKKAWDELEHLRTHGPKDAEEALQTVLKTMGISDTDA